MIPGVVLGWLAGVGSSMLMLLLKTYLAERRDQMVYRREINKDDRTRRIETDRQIHQKRITVLIRSYLAAYVRSGKWWNTRTDLERLLASLEQGGYEHFVDVAVDRAWVELVAVTVRMARRRRAETLTHEDIHVYNHARKLWEDQANRSFGPLPSSLDLSGRHAADHAGDRDRDELTKAA